VGIPSTGKVLVANALLRAAQHHQLRRAIALLKGKAEQIEHNGKVVYGNFLCLQPSVFATTGFP